MNLLFAGIVFIPAMVVYSIVIGFSLPAFLMQLICLLAITALSQSIACLLGWLLHLLLSKLNKSIASMLYLVLFLGTYFYVYSQANSILQTMVTNGQAVADTLSWVWPIYALGQGCSGNLLQGLLFALISILCFAGVYALLSVTFTQTAVMSTASSKRTKLILSNTKRISPAEAIIKKELGKYLGTPVYLTNMGVGLLITVALTVAGLIFRSELLVILDSIPQLSSMFPLIICGMLCYLISTICIYI